MNKYKVLDVREIVYKDSYKICFILKDILTNERIRIGTSEGYIELEGDWRLIVTGDILIVDYKEISNRVNTFSITKTIYTLIEIQEEPKG